MNIFEQGKALSTSNFYFKNVGDQVQGTYVGKRTGERDNFDNEGTYYELQVPDGIVNVFFTASKKINQDMDHVKFGQVIGFKYVSRDKFLKNGREVEFKNIKVFADPKMVDQGWLDMHDGGKVNDSGIGKIVTEDKPKGDAGFGVFGDDNNEQAF